MLPKTCARRARRKPRAEWMGGTFSSWRRSPRDGDPRRPADELNPRDAAMALDEDTHLFRRALRKHDRRLDKQVGAARRLRRAERRAGDATPSSPTFHGPTVASVGRRGGGLGEFGLEGGAHHATTTEVAARGGGSTHRGPMREYDIIRAECARKMELAERNKAKATSRRRREHARGEGASNRGTRRREEATPVMMSPMMSPTHKPRDDDEAASRLPERRPEPVATTKRGPSLDARDGSQLNKPPPPKPPSVTDSALRDGYEQVKVFRDGNSLFHCARLGEIVCQAREHGAELACGRGDSVAAVLRRGIRSLGQAQAAATAAALRRGAMERILSVEDDESNSIASTPGRSGGDASSDAAALDAASNSLAPEMNTKAVDDAIVVAVRGAKMLDDSCPGSSVARGAPLDNWRRALVDVGTIALAEAESGAYGMRDEDLYDAAVRRAYCDAMCRSNVPATFVEVAALASHLRRPITVIRGPVGAGVDAGVAPRSGERMYRARCVSEVVGARYAAGGREGFTLFWELAEGVPTGLPAGDFVLLVPRSVPTKLSVHRRNAGEGTSNAARLGRRSPLSPGLSRAAPAQETERGSPATCHAGSSGRTSAREQGMLAAASDGNKIAVHRHVSRGGASLDAVDQSGDTVLHRAARGGSIGLIKVCIKHAGSPNQPSLRQMLEQTNAAGRTPLQVAVDAKRVKAARFLRREGASDPRGELDVLQGAPWATEGGGYASSGYSSSGVDSASESDTNASESDQSEMTDSDISDNEAGGFGNRRRGTKGTEDRIDAVTGTWDGHGAPALFDKTPEGRGTFRETTHLTQYSRSAYDRLGTSEYATSDAMSSDGMASDASDASDKGFRRVGGWSDVPTPSGSEAASDAGSLWNSESESEWAGTDLDVTSTSGMSSASEDEFDDGAGVHGDRARLPSFLR